MPISFSDLKTNLYNWATANVPVGMPVIYYYANAPRPVVDYISLNISSFVQIGTDYVPQPIDDAGDVSQVGDREFTLSIQAYGGQVFEVLENLRTSLQKSDVLQLLAQDGIAYVQWLGINDITDIVNSRYEYRASLDLLFRVAQIYTDTLGSIDSVELTEIIDNVDGTNIITETILIPPA